MPRHFHQPQPAKRSKVGAPTHLQRLRAEIRSQQTSVRPESEPRKTFRDSVIGRPVLGRVVELTDDAEHVLRRENAKFHPEGPGILYVRSAPMLRFAAGALLTREIIEKQINRLDTPTKTQLQVNRGEVWLRESPFRGNMVQTYDILAPIVRTYKHGEPTIIPILEQEKFADMYETGRKIKTPELWLGYINLPKDSGAAEDVAHALDDTFADTFTVGAVQFFNRQQK